MNRMTRRTLLAGTAGLAAAGILADGRAATPADTLVQAKRIDDIISLDPAEVFEWTPGEVINNVYDRLVTYDPADFSRRVGGAAESWAAGDDGASLTLRIRSGLRFATGREATAADAAFSLRRVVRLGKTPAFLLTQFGWTPENVEDRVAVRDDRHLLLRFDKPYALDFVLDCLTAGVASLVDAEEAERHAKDGDWGYDWLRTHSAGTGAYRLVAWTPKEAVVLEANPAHRHGAPPVRRVIIRHVGEAGSQRLLLERGDADIARDLTGDQLRALENHPGIAIQAQAKTSIIYLGLNTAVAPLAKPKVREALRWLIDYDGLAASVLKGSYLVRQAPLVPGQAGALEENPFRLDPARARTLLAEAGFAEGFPLELLAFNGTPYSDIAQSIQATFAQGGIAVKLTRGDRKDISTQIRARRYQAGVNVWSPDYLDPNSTVNWFGWSKDIGDAARTRNAAWRENWLIPELSRRTEAALVEPDAARRTEAYGAIQRELRADGPSVFLFQLIEQVAVRKGVEGFVQGPSFDTPVYWRTRKAGA